VRPADSDADPAAPVPDRLSLKALREAAPSCRACELWRPATQVVFGEGRKRSRLLLVGEQPGDREDREGRPFVGPAGRLLDRALADAGIDRDDVYVTNAVKHFRFQERGKRRLHMKPEAVHLRACLPWLEAELRVVRPEVVVCMGATAARSLLGGGVRVTHDRGRWLADDAAKGVAGHVAVTVHPSSILRERDADARHAAYAAFAEDLMLAADVLETTDSQA
jgi:uracil-DNA glycosylase family protein